MGKKTEKTELQGRKERLPVVIGKGKAGAQGVGVGAEFRAGQGSKTCSPTPASGGCFYLTDCADSGKINLEILPQEAKSHCFSF